MMKAVGHSEGVSKPNDANESVSIQLVVTTTPAMHCANCESKIKSHIRFVKGTKKIETSVPGQTVTIVYDSRKSTYADFEAAFKKIGYAIRPARKSR